MAACIVGCLAPSGTQTAVANGDTRTIVLFHAHTKESISATFRSNGSYDSAALKQLNWFLRDWRRDEPTTMDPRLFDVLWEAYRAAGAQGREIVVVSAYRSPETNSMLRRRSRAVAKQSQHMAGKAMDTHMPGMSMAQVREVAMRLQRGGVGYYPTAGTPFVHLDVGSVRSWPRMSYDQLARLFPDGKTVHLPSNGQPLARYEEARAELEASGGVYLPPSSTSRGFFAWLFGGGGGDDDEVAAAAPTQRYERGRMRTARGGREAQQVAAYAPTGTGAEDDGGARGFMLSETSRAPAVTRAERDLPRGDVFVSAPPQVGQPAPAAAGLAPAQLTPPPQVTAGLSPVDARQKPEPLDDEKPAAKVEAPLPPRRPTDLPLMASAPLPPARPTTIAALAPPSVALKAPIAAQPRGPITPSLAALRPIASARGEDRTTVSSVLGPGIAGPRTALRANAGLAVGAADKTSLNSLILTHAPSPPPRPRTKAN